MIYVTDGRQRAVVLLPDLSGAKWQTIVPVPVPVPAPVFVGLAVTVDGRFVIADRSRSVILVMDPDGANPATLDPASSVGALRHPSGVAVDDAGAVYVADTGNQRIVRASGFAKTIWSAYGTAGPSAPGEFLAPTSIALDGAGRIVVADPAAGRVVRFDDMAGLNWTVLALPEAVSRPYGVSCDPVGALITELLNRAVLRLAPDDTVKVVLDGADDLVAPIAAAVDGKTIVVADAGTAQLSRWIEDGGTWSVAERLLGVPRALPGPHFTRLGGMVVT